MIRHFFLDKTNSIYKSRPLNNVGLNPILELDYGGNAYISRGLVHFDETEIKSLVEDKTFADTDKLSFRLKMTNCFSVDGYPYEKLLTNGLRIRERACSFDIYALRLPKSFDEGRGFDYVSDFWINNNRSFSKFGSSWMNCKTEKQWDENGVYSLERVKEEIALYESGEASAVITMQHFDFGNENLDMDITQYVMDVINGEDNNGILLMFSPLLEESKVETTQYVGFFTDHTNTFFHPYVECIYDNAIMDDRAHFCAGKVNKLYLYCNIDGIPENLDNIPTCTIDDEPLEVTQETKGVYSVTVSNVSKDLVGTLGYDTWSDLTFNGESLDDIEDDFEIHAPHDFISVGKTVSTKNTFIPTVYGINDSENLNVGEVREVTVDFRYQFETFKMRTIDCAEYRIYVKDGNREVTVFDYQPVERGFLKNFFVINTDDMIPNRYYIDIKVKNGRDVRYHKDVLHFNVVSDVTERYE